MQEAIIFFDRKKIEKDKVLLSIANLKEFEEIENIGIVILIYFI